MKSFAKVKQGYAYFILVIDVFSRFVHTFPLCSTRGQETASVLETFFRTGRKLITDKGTAYRNRDVQCLLKREKMDHFFTKNEQKSSYAERAIKTIKSNLSRYMSRHQTHRWIDVLDSMMQCYNGSYHRSIKMTPRGVTKRDESRNCSTAEWRPGKKRNRVSPSRRETLCRFRT